MAVQEPAQNEPFVSLLLQQPGIDVNAKDKDGYAALHYMQLTKTILKEKS